LFESAGAIFARALPHSKIDSAAASRSQTADVKAENGEKQKAAIIHKQVKAC